MAKRAAVLACTLLLQGAAWAADLPQSPRAFVERLYAAYDLHGRGNNFAYPAARTIVDAPLLALLHRDRLMSKGEVGALDGDPICQCQDWGQFKVLSIRTHNLGSREALADVTFANAGSTGSVHFDLVIENGGWKIHDISSRDTPSFQAHLRNYKY